MRALPFTICALWFLSSACGGTSSSISVTAPSAAKCQVAVENAPHDAAPADGMSGSVAINTTRDCTWTASSNAAWLAITSATTGQGSETLTYKVSANAEPVARRGILEVNNTQVQLAQDAAPCRYSVSPTNTTVSANGGDVAISMETLTGCAWTAASQAAWITLPPTATGNRSGTLTLTVARNTATAPRTGAVTVGPHTVTIQQAAAALEPDPAPVPAPTPTPTPGPTPAPTPAPCTFDISPTSAMVGSDATTGSIQITAGAGCAWTASENSSWLTIASGASGSGNGRVEYRVSANGGAARSDTITAAGKTFSISQAAAPPPACIFSISPTTQGFADAGGSGSIAISASANSCAWTATTSAPWISLGGNSGIGNGNVGFTVAVNTEANARSATIAVAGKTFTVSQQGAPPPAPCTFSISPATQDVADAGGSGSVAVTASAGTCTWTATSNAPWLTFASGASGTGNGAVGVVIAANTAAARSGTITIAGQTFTVSQAAAPAPCTFTISPTSQNVAETATATSGTIAVAASTGTCAWTAASSAPWLLVTAGASGTGNGTVAFKVEANTGTARTATIAVGGQTFTLSQAAPPPPPPPPCTFSISPTSQDVAAAGVNGSVTVTASASTCTWTATANIDWLVVVSGSPGTGSGTVSYSVAATTEGGDRNGTITIAGQTFTVTQRHP
jgi:all-beta uncharacterized protein/BACON domain-containing protein